MQNIERTPADGKAQDGICTRVPGAGRPGDVEESRWSVLGPKRDRRLTSFKRRATDRRLPLETGQDVPEQVALGPSSHEGASAALGANILLIHPHPEELSSMRDALRGVGFGWVVAESGKRALEILRSCPEWYDLVLVHLRLPCISGGTLIRQIVKEMPGLYIVAQAGDWSAGEIRDAYEAGAQVLLRKGQDPRNIADTLVRSLNLVREHRSAAQRRLAHEQKRAKAPWYQQVGHWGRRLVLAPSGSATKGRLTLAAIGTAFLLLGIFVGWLIQGGLTETDVVRARAARFLDAFERMGGKEPSDRKFEHWYQGQRLDLERNRTEEVHRSHAEEMESRRIDSNLKDAEEGSRPLPKTQDRHNR